MGKGRSETYCYGHRQTKPCQSCMRSSNTRHQRWLVDPVMRERHIRSLARRENAWFEDEIAIVRSQAGMQSAVEITRQINAIRAQYGLKPRRHKSVCAWGRDHGFSFLCSSLYSTYTLSKLLGVSSSTIRDWRRAGSIYGRPWGQMCIVYDEQEVIRFVNTMPWLVAFERIRPGPVRRAAEVASRRDPWLSVEQFSQLVPCARSTVFRYLRKGFLRAQRHVGQRGVHRIQASQIQLVRERIALSHYRHLPIELTQLAA